MVRNVFIVLILLTVLAEPIPGRAAPERTAIQVNTTSDDLVDNHNCTLREALLAANSDGPVDSCPGGSGTDLILLPAGKFIITIEGVQEDAGLTGDMDIYSSLTLRGAGEDQTFVDAQMLDRVLDILPGSHIVQVEDMTISNGSLGNVEYEEGAPPLFGAGIRNQAELSLIQVTTFCPNNDYIGYDIHGVGISNTGKLFLEDSTVRGARAGYATGGGIYNSGDLTATNSSITDNYVETGRGPGIFNTGSARLNNMILDWNRQDVYDNTDGGNIYNSGDFRCEICSILGGVGHYGAVIYNNGYMALTDTQVAYGTTRYGYGAAVYTSGSLDLLRTKVFDSTMRGIWGSGALSIIDSEISNNRATTWANYPEEGGGGLYFDGDVFISGTLFMNNQAVTHGGAILGSGQWIIQDSALTGNAAYRVSPEWDFDTESGMGGGIYWNGGKLIMTNTTLSGNLAADGGPGILIQMGEVELNSVTMALNRSIDLSGGGGLALIKGKAVLSNTILAGNLEQNAPDCFQFTVDPVSGEPGTSEVISLGYNLVGIVTGCHITSVTGDQIGTAADPLDPLLAPLADNGGNTPTHALLPASPALDGGPILDCPTTDQRGVSRPQGPACDIGAFELEQPDYWMMVEIDVRPGNSSNPINPNSGGTVPVAIFSTQSFYAPTEVDPTSLTFGRTGTEESLVSLQNPNRPDCHLRDANRDKVLDLVCRFLISEMGFQPGDIRGYLRGLTHSGQPVSGEDSVTILYPTTLFQDDQDTLLDLRAYLGDALLWLPLIPSGE